jgi:hypothetical protein
MEAVMRAARDSGAMFVWPNVLYLKPGTKEWFMPVLREAYPHLEGKYERYYKGTYAPKDYTREVIAQVNELRAEYGFGRVAAPEVHQRPQAGQLALGI